MKRPLCRIRRIDQRYRVAEAYEEMIGLLVDTGQTVQAWQFAERARSQAFLEMLGNRRIPAKDAPPELQARLSALDGMTRSLRYAGCDQILASLWPVSDAVTAQWMETFYRCVQSGDAYSDAVRTASLRIRDDHPAPFFWAAFVLMN